MISTEQELARLAEMTGEELVDRGQRMMALGRELMGMSAQLSESPSAVKLSPAEVRALEPEQKSVGRLGAVTDAVAMRVARELGEFTVPALAEALGVDPAGAMKWAGRLLDMDGVVVREGRTFRCLLKPPLKIWVLRQAGSVFTAAEAVDGSDADGIDAVMTELEALENEGVVNAELVDGQWLYEYVPPDDPSPNEHPTRTPPEKLPPSYDLAPKRGQPVRIRSQRDQRKIGSTSGGARRKMVDNEREYAKLVATQEQRAAELKARQQARAQAPGKRKPR